MQLRLLVVPFVLACGVGLPAASASEPEGCVTASCHTDFKSDVAHLAKGVTCVKCHANVPDGAKEHKGALDDLEPKKICSQAGCHAETSAKVKAGPHKDVVCEGCHNESHGKFARTDWTACKSCHGDPVKALATSVHGMARKSVRCIDCHGDLHAPKLHSDGASPMGKILQVTTCGECHDSQHVRVFRTSVHGQGLLRSGLSVAPTCSDCHGAHDIAKVDKEASRVSKAKSVETCGKCHTFILSRWKESTHGLKWLAGDTSKGPVCITCHSGHRTFDPMVYDNNLKMADTCGGCHQEQSRSYRDSFHGKATRLGLGAAATCADCHTPHWNLPKSDERSSVNPKNLAETCGRCHPGANGEFLKFDVHANPHDKSRDARLYWIYTFMTLLLIGVLGFFALHTILWLQRSIVGWKRNEIGWEPVPGEPWVRRFKKIHIGIHVAIVLSFLLLGASGLPLKFSGHIWAKPIEAILGGPDMTRFLHRLAGVVSFGYAGVFLAYLLRETFVKRSMGLYWGWQSMVPQRKDLEDLFANLRWFLYLGKKPPQLDRWAYWEKFDFFAVFWGIPVIGLSGLMLWAPMFFSHILPAWALNAAYVIHSDEALLATGFIFCFHLFHTHLRPESFPLDTVVFLGGMPLSRFKHERPAEYARAVAEGTLERQFMPEPSDRAKRRALYFGFTALTIGVILAVLLLGTGFMSLWH